MLGTVILVFLGRIERRTKSGRSFVQKITASGCSYQVGLSVLRVLPRKYLSAFDPSISHKINHCSFQDPEVSKKCFTFEVCPNIDIYILTINTYSQSEAFPRTVQMVTSAHAYLSLLLMKASAWEPYLLTYCWCELASLPLQQYGSVESQ
jgi:hypothetical protein